jgi:nucleotide-binding universal stress UspA family protein
MLRKLLIPTDISDYSKAVINYLPNFKQVGAEEVSLLYVINLTKIDGVSGGVDVERYISSESEIAEKELPELAKRVGDYGLRVEVVQPYPAGDPTIEILKVSENYDLILLGSRGRGLIREILLGSVSEGVIHNSPTPVFVFKLESKKEKKEFPGTNLFKRILVGYDSSNYSIKALEYAEFISKRIKGKIHLLHVRERNREFEIESVAEDLANKGIDVETAIRDGSTGREILKYAEEVGATAIFIGKGKSFRASLLGSTSDFVVRRSCIPVFVYRKRE